MWLGFWLEAAQMFSIPLSFLLFWFAQESTPMASVSEELTVSTSLVHLPLETVNRQLTVYRQEDIQRLGATDLQHLLAMTCGVHLSERGAFNVQADVSIRGSSFEQTALVVDGLRYGDPQTGHHLLNLAIPLESIERVEILKGPGSRLFGPNALGGVIHIISKKPTRSQHTLSLLSGLDETYGLEGSWALVQAQTTHRVAFSDLSGDGDQPNRDMHLKTAYVSGHHQDWSWKGGVHDKTFGANRFYHPDFPWQREAIQTFFGDVAYEATKGDNQFKIQAGLRRHKDTFWLDAQRPDFYVNHHQSTMISLHGSWSRPNTLGWFTSGLKHEQELLDSSNLGDRERQHSGLFVEQTYARGKFMLVAGASFYDFDGDRQEFFPGIELGFSAGSGRWFASINRGFRLPTFTELYYQSPANQGNPLLFAESAWEVEGGWRGNAGLWNSQAALFLRRETDKIDYVWDEETRIYQAFNFSKAQTGGFEGMMERSLPGMGPSGAFHLGYQFLEASLDQRGAVTKYAMTHPKHQAIVRFSHQGWGSTSIQWQLRAEQMPSGESRTLCDTHWRWPLGRHQLHLTGKNLFNEQTEDVLQVPLYGSWFGLKFTLQDPF
jgi:iron complex outermembrane receptor protein